MVFRVALAVVAAGALALFLATRDDSSVRAQRTGSQPAPPTATTAPAFSPWYAEALRSIGELEESDVHNLQRQLAGNPEDAGARLKLMAYHQRGDRAHRPDDVVQRFQHVLWLIEHHPDSEILHSYVAHFAPGQLTAAQFQRATALWEAAAKADLRNAAIQWNAATFFESLDSSTHLRYLEATAAADPNHPHALRPLAHAYTMSLLAGGPTAARASAALDASANVWILGNAAHMLQSQYNASVQTGSANTLAARLAERYFLRAQGIDKNLDRAKILPQVDMDAVLKARQEDERSRREWQERFERAVPQIRRLPVDAFPELPPAVATVLRARNCSVPQPLRAGKPVNVVQGEFFEKGEAGWAVLCSVRNATTLLVFRNSGDTEPEAINQSDDIGYLQMLGPDEIGYSRQISAADGKFIMAHYRAYGGPEPPPIDHHGIDDAFLEKASVTYYFHNGKWLGLQGAD